MNLPNKLTITRIIMTPVFMFCLLCAFRFHYLVAMLIFIAASLTDMFDGKYARKHNLITNFGKFLDPIADKMLTTSALLGFIALNIGAGTEWVTFIILLREFIVTGVRLSAASSGKVIAANIWGKAKTVVQMISLIYGMFAQFLIFDCGVGSGSLAGIVLSSFTTVFLWLSAVLTVISGVIYLVDNKSVIDTNN